MTKFELLHRQSCPYCAKVRAFIEANQLRGKIPYSDIDQDTKALARLKAMTDDIQVPCLVVDGKAVLESDAIIAWLDSHLLHGAA